MPGDFGERQVRYIWIGNGLFLEGVYGLGYNELIHQRGALKVNHKKQIIKERTRRINK